MNAFDTADEKHERNDSLLRVGLIGGELVGQGMVATIESAIPGMKVGAIYNRELTKASEAFDQAGISNYLAVKYLDAADLAIFKGYRVISSNPKIICRMKALEAIIVIAAEVELGAKATLDAIRHKKHVVLLNSDLDATIGPILKIHANQHEVILINADGDQPGVMMNLYHFAKAIGYRPVLGGSINGIIDYHLTPKNKEVLDKTSNPCIRLATAFADGTKLAMKMAVVANARAALLNDAAIPPLLRPVCGVVTTAKKRLKKGTRLDGIGGLTCYGTLENADLSIQNNLLPMGLSLDCTLVRNVIKAQSISFDQVRMPAKSLCHQLWKEQTNYFHLEKMAG